MKKIAVCLPTFNEEDMIQITCQKVDAALKSYICNYKTYIINCDSGSTDKTTTLFCDTETISEKICLKFQMKGKGINILNFMEFCTHYDVDYAVMLDVDVISMKSSWVEDFLNELIWGQTDFVLPSYKRSRFEGSTTNWFAFPIIFGLTGYAIRQPIAGDFAFNKQYIEYINRQVTNCDIQAYGIDIFLTMNALYGGFRITTLSLGQKAHKPSFPKMYNMFGQVLRAAIFTLNSHENIYLDDKDDSLQQLESNIISGGKFRQKEEALKLREKSYFNLCRNCPNTPIIKDVLSVQDWCDIMFVFTIQIMDHHTFSDVEIQNYIDLFVIHTVTFWNNAEKMSVENVETQIIEFAKILRRRVKKYVKEKN